MDIIHPDLNFKDADLNRVEITDRRDFMKGSLAALVGGLLPLWTAKNAYAITNFASWKVNFKFQHTGETFNGVYRVGDRYLPEAFDKINTVLRDYRTGEAFPMDPRVIDIISMLQQKTGSERYNILSGYRSPKTNNNLRSSSSGVARNSYHMYGQALDVQAPSSGVRALRQQARALRAGGVGYYPRSNFVHVDTGDVRSWS